MQPERLEQDTPSVATLGESDTDALVVMPDYCTCDVDMVGLSPADDTHKAGKCVRKPEYTVKRKGITLYVCDKCLIAGDIVQ